MQFELFWCSKRPRVSVHILVKQSIENEETVFSSLIALYYPIRSFCIKQEQNVCVYISIYWKQTCNYFPPLPYSLIQGYGVGMVILFSANLDLVDKYDVYGN